MPPYFVKCKTRGCESVLRSTIFDERWQFEDYIKREGWIDGECTDCVASQGTEEGTLQIPLASGMFVASVPGKITNAEWRTIRDVIGALSGCDDESRNGD